MSSSDPTRWRPVILDEDVAEDRDALARLRGDPAVEFLDHRSAQLAGLHELRPPPGDDVLGERHRWVHYPWRRTVVGLLGPRAFRTLRLDRNRNLITAAEQQRLGRLSIGVAGLSVGHVIAHTLAAQGLCGQLRLADFDLLEVSNLNRVPATVLDLGVNKAVVTARRIAELDPYLPVTVLPAGVTRDTVDGFVDGLDVVIEECDSLDIKAVVREVARRHRVPVLMATSDRGLIDVERFDLEPERPILHGLLGAVDAETLAGMSARDKIPHMLGHLDVPRASARAAASMVEVGRTLTTWPQLAADVVLGATTVAEAVRRLGLGEPLPSGRTRVDVSAALDGLAEPPPVPDPTGTPAPEPPEVPADVVARIAAAANRAPSGGNAQPWRIVTQPDSVSVRLNPDYRATIDVGHRGSAVAVGAAVFNARVAAAAHRMLGPLSWQQDPLTATLRLEPGEDAALADQYEAMWHRETNRNRGAGGALDRDALDDLQSAALAEGARLQMIAAGADTEALIDILAATDRIRYLTPRLHHEMISELRWPADPEPDSGIEVGLLGLDDSDLAVLEVLRRPDVMAHLADWEAGSALGDEVGERIRVSSGLGVVWVDGRTLGDYARGGAAAEAVWIAAAARGLAVQPISPVFLHAHDEDELQEVSADFAPHLHELSGRFRRLVGVPADAGLILLLRFAAAPPTAGRSRRRALTLSHRPER
ncbi:Rv1355c family protein [[Mycobacterium] burgundiense]|uniref:Rv1355c family protein n=1 Tax=[Mycobacterium] burgundiense TaxID=3064286 RepID=A0ABM9M362_9MYCO|nr:Rv1355c family protein [Mycolicibacterium sp. MU0053]CAJ1509413.1 Rv1355c family protein [Mycolicibacterium sp. MU0053]